MVKKLTLLLISLIFTYGCTINQTINVPDEQKTYIYKVYRYNDDNSITTWTFTERPQVIGLFVCFDRFCISGKIDIEIIEAEKPKEKDESKDKKEKK